MVRQQIQRISKIVSPKVTVPSPVCIWVGIVPRAVTAVFSMIRTAAHFMPVRAGMCMDTGPVTGERDAVLIYKAVLHGWSNGSGTEYLLEKLFVIKRKFIPGNSFFCHDFSNFRMAVREFFPFSGLIGRLPVFTGRIVLFVPAFVL